MTASRSSPLLVEDRGAVRWIWFNRPEVHNAQDVEMLELLDDALIQTSRDSEVRVVVLAGKGKSFCSGHDLNQMATNREYAGNNTTVEGRFHQEMRLFVDPVERFRALTVPTICRVQGSCLAAGLMFAGAADMVVAADDAKFGSPILKFMGVNDAEVFTFGQRLGERRAKQMIWLDDRLDADEALRVGAVNWVVSVEDLDGKVTSVAEQLATLPPQAVLLSKSTFQFAADRRGERDVNRFHYMTHQLSHHTSEALGFLEQRVSRVERGEPAIAPEQRRASEGPAR